MSAVTLPNCNDTKERLSLAYLRAVAARCRCIVKPEEGGDYGSVDAWLTSIVQPRKLIWVQLKCTSKPLDVVDNQVCYDLPVSNYNHLRSTDTPAVQLLLVHELPENDNAWMEVSDKEMVFRRATWWTDLYGAPATTNGATVRVKIPTSRVFSPASLTKLLDAIGSLPPGAARKPAHDL